MQILYLSSNIVHGLFCVLFSYTVKISYFKLERQTYCSALFLNLFLSFQKNSTSHLLRWRNLEFLFPDICHSEHKSEFPASMFLYQSYSCFFFHLYNFSGGNCFTFNPVCYCWYFLPSSLFHNRIGIFTDLPSLFFIFSVKCIIRNNYSWPIG